MTHHCVNCNISEQETPLITLEFKSGQVFICPQCLPILIHKPQNLADKIPGYVPPANLAPHEH